MNREQFWEQRFLARDWTRALQANPRAVLSSARVVWRLEELLDAMHAATGAKSVTAHALARMLRKVGFNKAGKGDAAVTCDGAMRLWIMRPGMKISGANAAKIYNEEREGQL